MSPRNTTIRAALALTMALGAVAPAAHARNAVDPEPQALSAPPQDVKSAQDLRRAVVPSSQVRDVKSAHDLRGPAPTSSLAGSVDSGRHVITVSSPNGFDWGDAAIGAAGGLGLALAALGSTLVVTGRRRRPIPRQLVS
jgi:hypothetical protein